MHGAANRHTRQLFNTVSRSRLRDAADVVGTTPRQVDTWGIPVVQRPELAVQNILSFTAIFPTCVSSFRCLTSHAQNMSAAEADPAPGEKIGVTDHGKSRGWASDGGLVARR